MSIRKPIVINSSGSLEELPEGDTLDLSYGFTQSTDYPEIGIEKLTSKRHIANGKPIYVQGFAINIASSPVDIVYSTGVMGAEQSSVIQFYLPRSNGSSYSSSYTYYVSETNEMSVRCDLDATKINVNLLDGNSTIANKVIYVTLEYTKTVDTNLSQTAFIEITKRKGEVLQVGHDIIPIQTSQPYLFDSMSIMNIEVVPKSINSTLIVELSFPYKLDPVNGSNFTLDLYVNSILVQNGLVRVYLNKANTNLQGQVMAVGVYTNNSKELKNVEVKVGTMWGNITHKANSAITVLKVTEIQN